MDINSIAPAVFALTVFLVSVAATIAASIISKRVLDEQAEAKNGYTRNVNDDVPARANEQEETWKEDSERKAA